MAVKHHITSFLAAAAVCAFLVQGVLAAAEPPNLDFGKFKGIDLVPDFLPGYKPSGKRDEIGFWYKMDEYEEDLKNSPFIIEDSELNAYVSEITCKLAGDYCADIRVYIVKTPFFNATMAPNGVMTVWSGLLLRTRNEAQLAAVLGHELGHYFKRHSIKWWRSTKKKTAAANFFTIGSSGYELLIPLLLLVSVFSYSRENEREADAYGLKLMLDAGYDPIEASLVWRQLVEERDANGDKERGGAMFSTHPSSDERMKDLNTIALDVKGQRTDLDNRKARYVKVMKPYRSAFMEDQLNFPKLSGTEYLLDELIEAEDWKGELYYYKGELYRRRGGEGDYDKALEMYNKALALENMPAEIWRSIGMIYLKQKKYAAAREEFKTYLSVLPEAEDREMIEFYMQYGG